MAKNGRPTKLTEELLKQIVDYIQHGNYIEVACEAAGICKQTFYNWKNRGEKAKSGIYKNFFDAIKKAEAEAEVLFLKNVEAASSGWQASAWYLERKYPDRWGRRDKQLELEKKLDELEKQFEELVYESKNTD